ncbi:hypothetical protein [Rhizobium sp. SG2393]|uniref:hypothetical protein n=1 Tax=Rhizobium sp. SG2393 TaxID=3276279 RepID=UPI00366DBE7B
MNTFLRAAFGVLIFSAATATAAEKDMTKVDFENLLKDGKTLQLGGKGMGYTGSLVLTSDGKASGSALPDGGQKIDIVGTWRIKDNKFCRTWEKLDGGKEICERWRLVAPNKVEVYQGKKKMGVNSWN